MPSAGRTYRVRGVYLAAGKTVDRRRSPNEFTAEEVRAYRAFSHTKLPDAKVREMLTKHQVLHSEANALSQWPQQEEREIDVHCEHARRAPSLAQAAMGKIRTLQRDPVTHECTFEALCPDGPTLQRCIKYASTMGVSMKHRPAYDGTAARLEEITLTFDPARDGCHINSVECIDEDGSAHTIYSYTPTAQSPTIPEFVATSQAASEESVAMSTTTTTESQSTAPAASAATNAVAPAAAAANGNDEKKTTTTTTKESSKHSRSHGRRGRGRRSSSRRRDESETSETTGSESEEDTGDASKGSGSAAAGDGNSDVEVAQMAKKLLRSRGSKESRKVREKVAEMLLAKHESEKREREEKLHAQKALSVDNASVVDQMAAMMAKFNRTSDGSKPAMDVEQLKQGLSGMKTGLDSLNPEMRNMFRHAIATSMQAFNEPTNAFGVNPMTTPFVEQMAKSGSTYPRPAASPHLQLDMSNPDVSGQVDAHRKKANDRLNEASKSSSSASKKRSRHDSGSESASASESSDASDASDSDVSGSEESESDSDRHRQRHRHSKKNRDSKSKTHKSKAHKMANKLLHTHDRNRRSAESVSTSYGASAGAGSSAAPTTSSYAVANRLQFASGGSAREHAMTFAQRMSTNDIERQLQKPNEIYSRIGHEIYRTPDPSKQVSWEDRFDYKQHVDNDNRGVPMHQFYKY